MVDFHKNCRNFTAYPKLKVSMKNPELAHLFYQEIIKNHPDTPPSSEHIQKLYQLLVALFLNVTEKEKIQFTTLFSRITFAFQKHQVPSRRQFFIHQFRRQSQKLDKLSDTLLIYQLGIKALTDAIKIFYDEDASPKESPLPVEIVKILPPSDFYQYAPIEIKQKTPFLRVVVLKIDPEKEQLIGVEEETNEQVVVQYYLA